MERFYITMYHVNYQHRIYGIFKNVGTKLRLLVTEVKYMKNVPINLYSKKLYRTEKNYSKIYEQNSSYNFERTASIFYKCVGKDYRKQIDIRFVP